MRKTYILSFVFIFLSSLNNLIAQPVIPISQARQLSIGTTATIRGIILNNGTELGTIRYIQDATAGMGLFDTNNPSLAALQTGDSVQVTGVLFDFNNLLEFQPVTNITLISNNNALPNPQIITPSQLDENVEGELIRFNNVTFANAGSTFSGNSSYIFSNTNGESAVVYIRTGSPLVGTVIPTGSVDLIGIGSQFFTQYQLLLRNINDIVTPLDINILTPVVTSDIEENSFTLSWTTDIEGFSRVQYGLTPNLELGITTATNPAANHSVNITGLEPGNVYYCRAYSVAGNDTAFSVIRPFVTKSLSSGDIKVYFNKSVDNSLAQPADNLATQLFEAIDDTLIAYIDRASETLDLTIYDFNNTDISSISEAINDAYDRGVAIRFIGDGSLAASNLGFSELNPLIPVIQSPVSPDHTIMHNKFVIIDAFHSDPNKSIVWTGATNWTDRQINTDPNSVIIIQDQSLAKAYTLEFNEMWGSNNSTPNTQNARFGQFKTDNTPHLFNVAGKKVESFFSPSDNVNTQLLSKIAGANQKLYFASMLVTRSDIRNSLLFANNNGVEVKGIINSNNPTDPTGNQWNSLVNGLGTTNMLHHVNDDEIFHHKYMIVDFDDDSSEPLLWEGSHNWSNNANNRNDENTVVVYDAKIANLYLQEFAARFVENGGVLVSQNDIKTPKTFVFPNPAINSSVIQFMSQNEQTIQLKLIDLNGKTIANEQLISNGIHQFDLSPYQLKDGIYLIQLINGQKTENVKLIIQ